MRLGRQFGVAAFSLLLLASVGASSSLADFNIGTNASQYALLFEGGGGNTLQITNVTINGNVGVGGTGKATDSGPSTINGALNFLQANSGQFSNNNAGDVITGGVNYGVSNVGSALTAVNSLNSTLGAESGTNVAIAIGNGQTQIINASAGVLDANGNRVFNVTSFNTVNGGTLEIVGDAAGDSVVLNMAFSVNFNNQVKLVGINPDQVLFNFVGGSGLSGGPTLQINDNASSSPTNEVQGIFLDPNGAVSVTNANVLGRVFGGDSHDFQYVSGSTLTAPTAAALPEPASIVLLAVGFACLTAFAARRYRVSGCAR